MKKFLKVAAIAGVLATSTGVSSSFVQPAPTVQAASKKVKVGAITYTIKKKEVRRSSKKGKKILVLHVNVKNNTKHKVSFSKFSNYTGFNAYQKVNGHWKTLTTAMTNSSSLIKKMGKLQHDLKPHKTIKNGVIMWTLENKSKVKVEFQTKYNHVVARRYYKVK